MQRGLGTIARDTLRRLDAGFSIRVARLRIYPAIQEEFQRCQAVPDEMASVQFPPLRVGLFNYPSSPRRPFFFLFPPAQVPFDDTI